jgi:cation diffusion facilitator CzcD-associated flavoprotein CzcO
MLKEAGLTDIVCFEKSSRLGGNWVYSPDDSHSSVCATTHLISSKWLSRYRDFPMPADYPDYPSHQQVLAYFEQYAAHFGLLPFIRFQTGVEKAQPLPDGRWSLTLADGSAETFDYLLVANGHHSVPRHPALKEQFTGRYLHAHHYKNNEGYAGQRVLVVGAGNSGCDCAVEISRVAARVDLSVRSPQYIVPKFFFGKPTDVVAARTAWLPPFLKNISLRMLLRFHVGRYRDYGLPEPDFPVTYAHPTVNAELLDKIRHGKVHPRPGIQSVKGRTLTFEDGQSAEYDVVVAATGYKIAFPFLDRSIADWEDATSIPLYLRIFHPAQPRLFFIGLVQPQGSVWPLSEAQARLVARHIQGKWTLPPDWQRRAYEEGKKTENVFQKHPRHAIEVHYHPYLKSLERLAGV